MDIISGVDGDGNLERWRSCVRVLSLIIYDGIGSGLECFPETVTYCLGLVTVNFIFVHELIFDCTNIIVGRSQLCSKN